MTQQPSRGYWFTNHLANPVLRPLLRSRAGRRFGRHLAVLRYRGRRTAQQHELIVQYVRDGPHVWVVPGQAEHKNWWRNFEEPRDVELILAGEPVRGRGIVIDGRADPARTHDALVAYLRGLPRASKALGVPPEGDALAESALADLAARSIVLLIDLRLEDSVPTASRTEAEEL